jgi:ATP-dependent protease ClpP protease subunit
MSKTTLPQPNAASPTNDRRWFAFRNATDSEVEIYLYDEIGFWGTGAKEFIAELRQHAGKHVHLRINSPGGEVIEGTAIYNALKRHAAGVTVHIDAMAASMASVIAMAGSPVFMADNALFMIHDPYTFAAGTSEELRKSADLLDTMKGNLVRSYVSKTGLPEKEIEEMMAAETWLGATEAVALGFADAIEDGVQAAASMSTEKAQARFDMLKKVMAKNQINPEVPETPEAPAPEAPALDAPVETPEVPETPVEPESPEAPQARIDVSAILDRMNVIAAERDQARADLAAARADLSRVSEALSNLEKTKGLAPASVVPAVAPQVVAVVTREDFEKMSHDQRNQFIRTGGKITE